jgi:hypothetical protein
MAARCVALLLCCRSTLGVQSALADGPSDNDLKTVRPVPKLGIDVPAEREEQL